MDLKNLEIALKSQSCQSTAKFDFEGLEVEKTPTLLDIIKNNPKLIKEFEMGEDYWNYMYLVNKLYGYSISQYPMDFPIIISGSIALKTFDTLKRTDFHDLDILVNTVDDKYALEERLFEGGVGADRITIQGYDCNDYHSIFKLDNNMHLCIFVSPDVKIPVVDNIYLSEPYSIFEAKAKYGNPAHREKYLNDLKIFKSSLYYKLTSIPWLGKIYKKYKDKKVAAKFKKYMLGRF